MPELARRRNTGALSVTPEIDPRRIGVAYVANCYLGFFTGQSDSIAPIVIGHAGLSGLRDDPRVEAVVVRARLLFTRPCSPWNRGSTTSLWLWESRSCTCHLIRASRSAAIATSGERSIATEMGMTWIGGLTMSSRRLMGEFGWTHDDFALVAQKNRAQRRPESFRRDPRGVVGR